MPAGGLLELVPNVAEGRRGEVIAEIAAAARAPAGVHLLDVHSDPDHNRSVLTLAGEAPAMISAALSVAAACVRLIDLSVHRGAHPRMGACDVVPFVPLEGTDPQLAAAAAVDFARRAWQELAVPCFLYDLAAPGPDHRTLPEIRRRAYVDLQPDVGTAPHATAGSCCAGAREVLVAYNVELATPDLAAAQSIARSVRESGGGLPHLRALAVPIGSRGTTQVSMNLVRPAATTMAHAFDAVAAAATAREVGILGAELVGLAPRAALGGREPEGLGLSAPPATLEEALAHLPHG